MRTPRNEAPETDIDDEADAIPLVPLAQPVYLDARGKPALAPPGYHDSHRETKWHNGTSRRVVIDLFVGTPQAGGPLAPPRNWEEKTGQRRYVWEPNETKALPHEYDAGIQQTRCRETECIMRQLACRDPEHDHEIIGGFGPQLTNLGMQKRPSLAPALDDEMARKAEAERKEFEAFKLAKHHEEMAMRARAEADAAQRDMDARAQETLEAEKVARQHRPKAKPDSEKTTP